MAPGDIDIFYATAVEVNPEEWSNQKSNYKNLSTITNRAKKQARMEKLKSFVITEYSESIMTGEIIDREWLKEVVARFFNRPRYEERNKIEKHLVYFMDFGRWWIEEMAPQWKTSKNKYLSKTNIRYYSGALDLWQEFYEKDNLKIKDIDRSLLSQFVDYLESKDFSSNYVGVVLARIKFFLHRAENMEISVNKSINERIFISKDEDVIDPYLNEEEIDSIYKLDLSHDKKLDEIRDAFIIGLWTGLRISDFNKWLDISNIEGDYFKIKTQKTNTWVMVPIHPYIKKILAKRDGVFPRKYSNSVFNENIRTICMLAEIDHEIKGKKIEMIGPKKKKRRRVVDTYKKWELVTSHICRRSFATNLHGLVDNDTLADLGGWAKLDMMLHYIKRTKKESADVLRQTWAEKYNI
jgi:site-specific recombinase XerD